MASSPIGGVLLYAFFPAVAVLVGGGVALIRAPGLKVTSAIQHLAAGVVFCALATELLPDLVHRKMPFITLLGFSLGVLAMLAIKSWSANKNEAVKEQEGGTTNFLIVLSIDFFIDGLLIGLGFAAGQKQGLLLTIALSLEVLFLGLAAMTSLGKSGQSRSKAMMSICGLAILLLIGATAGAVIISQVSNVAMDAVLAFGLAALLYLVTEELLVEAHEVPESPTQTAMFFAGFVALLTIEMFIY